MKTTLEGLLQRALQALVLPPEWDAPAGQRIIKPILRKLLAAGGFEAANAFVLEVQRKYPLVTHATDAQLAIIEAAGQSGQDSVFEFMSKTDDQEQLRINQLVFDTLLELLVACKDITAARQLVQRHARIIFGETSIGYLSIAELTTDPSDVAYAIERVMEGDEDVIKSECLARLAIGLQSKEALEALRSLAYTHERSQNPSAVYVLLDLLMADPMVANWTRVVNVASTLTQDGLRNFIADALFNHLQKWHSVETAQQLVLLIPSLELRRILQRRLSEFDSALS